MLKQESSADFATAGPIRHQLLQRIARMVDAVYIDTQLREQLYTMAIAPVDCADAGAQLFNSMGIRVLASEAYSYTIDRTELQRKLVTLAKGAARLDHVNEIARADVASRGGNPDEVEIYLAYQTGLASRLNLPWQSERMLYRTVAGVTDTMIDEAYDTVLALGEGDGLINTMLEQDFWERYLRETWPIQIETNKQLFQSKYEKLETLPATQLKWLKSTGLEKAGLRNKLLELINDLPVAESVVFLTLTPSPTAPSTACSSTWAMRKKTTVETLDPRRTAQSRPIEAIRQPKAAWRVRLPHIKALRR
ncbi:NEL-type E3 ubiquitin ligase domain-containing protein [Pseudomonas lini]